MTTTPLFAITPKKMKKWAAMFLVVFVAAICGFATTVSENKYLKQLLLRNDSISKGRGGGRGGGGDVAADTIVIEPRAFERWNRTTDHPLPCHEGGLSEDSRDGFVFVKVMKCASTTGTSITLRVARAVALQRQQQEKRNRTGISDRQQADDDDSSGGGVSKLLPADQPMCRVRTRHAEARQINWRKDDLTRTFVWSQIRHPTKRHVSWFFYQKLHVRNKTYSDTLFLNSFNPRVNSYQSWYLYPGKFDWFDLTPKRRSEYVNTILRSYNFLGVVERMDESAVALQMILGLNTSDVLFLSSKVSGSSPRIQSTFVTPRMQQYFESDEYKTATAVDMELYQAVNRSLDLTIDRLGRSEYDRQLDKFRTAKRTVDETCTREKWASVVGKRYLLPREWCVAHADWGCGFDCMDSLEI